MWRSSLWSISWLCHHMFYPYVTISQACKSDDLHHAMSTFSLLLCFNSGSASFRGAFEGQLRHNTTGRLLLLPVLEDAWLLSFVASHISRFFARPKKEEREKMAPSHGIDRDVRVKHLVMQPGNAPKARPSHLTTADVVNKVSEGLAFKDCKGRVLQRTQTLNWDTASLFLRFWARKESWDMWGHEGS